MSFLLERRKRLSVMLGCLLVMGGAGISEAANVDVGAEVLPSAAPEGEALWGPNSRKKLYLNLNDCMKRALIFNRELKMADHDVAKAEGKLREADIIGRPVLQYEHLLAPAPRDVGNAVGSFFSGDVTVFNRFKLGFGIPVTTFGKIKRAKALARGGIDAAFLQKAKKETEVIFQIRQLYYGVLLAREINRLLSFAFKRADKEATKREEEGGYDPVELLKLKLFRSQTSKRMHESQKKEILALEAMRVLLGLDRAQSFDVRRARLHPVSKKLLPFDHFVQRTYQKRPDIHLLQIGLRSRQLSYELEKYRYAPDLGIGGFFELGRAPGVRGVTTTDDFSDPFNFTRAGFGFQLKGKFDYGTRSAKIRQAEADLMKTRIQANLAIDGILLEVKQSYLNVKSAREELARARESSKLARQVLFLTQSNFDIGLAEPKDLIDGISQFMQTRGEYFKAVFDYNVAVAELDQKIGELPEINS